MSYEAYDEYSETVYDIDDFPHSEDRKALIKEAKIALKKHRSKTFIGVTLTTCKAKEGGDE